MPEQVGPCRFYLLSNGVQQNRTGIPNVSHKLFNKFLLGRYFIKLSIMHLTVINIRSDERTTWHSLSPTEPTRKGVATHSLSVPCNPVLSPYSHTQLVSGYSVGQCQSGEENCQRIASVSRRIGGIYPGVGIGQPPWGEPAPFTHTRSRWVFTSQLCPFLLVLTTEVGDRAS